MRLTPLHLTNHGCASRHDPHRVALVVAQFMADGEVFLVAVAALAQGLDVLQRRRFWYHMLATDPARHHAMQLARHGFVDFVAGKAQSAHALKWSNGVKV